jgi:DNA polymerase III epsilon subunit-like protein
MINNKICVFDFETDGKNPEECSPVQLSALIIDPIKLEIIPKSEFNTFLKPDKLCDTTVSNPYTDSDILEWHGRVRNVSSEQVLTDWKGYPEQKHAWSQFVTYLDKYHLKSNGGKKSQFTAPIAAGYNILRFDMPIVNRLSVKYSHTNKENETCLFHPRDKIDIMHLFGIWMSYVSEVKGLSLDSMRDYLGIDKTNAHNALKDVEDCAQILIRFLRLHKKLSQKIKFKDSFKV